MTLREFSTLVAAQRRMFRPRDLRDHNVEGKIHSQTDVRTISAASPSFCASHGYAPVRPVIGAYSTTRVRCASLQCAEDRATD